jgi:hypothetical protein
VQQPLEWKLHWLLRIGVFMEFVGHGAFGIRTKAGWLPFFEVFAIPHETAWRLMPVIGAIDILAGVIALLSPCRGVLLYMAAWGTFTALLRPAAGQGWWEFFERSYNYGAPAILLALHGRGHGFRSWIEPLRSVPRLPLASATTFLWAFRVVVALMLIGHGGYGVFVVKDNLLGHYAAAGLDRFGLPLETWRAGIGFFEIALGIAAFFTARPSYFVAVFGWKLLSEALHFPAGAEGALWEVVERGGCYMAPLAGCCLAHGLASPDNRTPTDSAAGDSPGQPLGSYAPS